MEEFTRPGLTFVCGGRQNHRRAKTGSVTLNCKGEKGGLLLFLTLSVPEFRRH